MLRDKHTHSLVSPSADSPSADLSPIGAPARRGRKPRPLDLEGERAKAEREEFRRREVEAIARVDPACELAIDPPVVWALPKVVADSPKGILLDVPRSSGRGLYGPRLVLAARSYDGTGAHGGDPAEYVSLHVNFRDGHGYLRRSIGVALHGDELRAVARALVDHADRLGVPE